MGCQWQPLNMTWRQIYKLVVWKQVVSAFRNCIKLDCIVLLNSPNQITGQPANRSCTVSYLRHSIFQSLSVVLLSIFTVSLVVFMIAVLSNLLFLIWGSQTPNQGHFIQGTEGNRQRFGIHNKQ